MTETRELAYKRKAKLRKKHRKVRAELVSEMVNLQMAVKNSRKGKEGVTNLIQLQCGGITYKVRSNNSYLDKQLRWFVENKHIPLKGWKFINWNMTGVGNPDYRIVRPDWTPEIGF